MYALIMVLILQLYLSFCTVGFRSDASGSIAMSITREHDFSPCNITLYNLTVSDPSTAQLGVIDDDIDCDLFPSLSGDGHYLLYAANVNNSGVELKVRR